mmetsp:Transcript_11424/g.38083  ORF Transcript_11424/g.38083 Transcript_11424/m.38083 type:complete len:318 (+) Transcript_11424:374-1327(+)
MLLCGLAAQRARRRATRALHRRLAVRQGPRAADLAPAPPRRARAVRVEDRARRIARHLSPAWVGHPAASGEVARRPCQGGVGPVRAAAAPLQGRRRVAPAARAEALRVRRVRLLCPLPPHQPHTLRRARPRRDPRHVAARSARAARPRRAVRRPRPRNLQRRRDPRLALALLHAHLALRPAHAQPRQFRVARRVPRPAAPLPCNRLLPRRGQRRGAGLVARDGAAGGQGPHLRRVERGLPVPVVARLVPRPRRHRRRGRAARPLGTRLCLLRHALGRAAGRDADGAHAVPRAEGRRAAHADARRRVGRLAAEAGAAD